MSARMIVALALALIAVQANSDPLGTSTSQTQLEQSVSTPSTQQTTSTPTTLAQPEAASTQQQMYGGPAQSAQQLSVPALPAQTTFEAVPLFSSASPVASSKGQSFYQQPSKVYSSKGGQVSYQQEQRLESAKQPVSQREGPVSFAMPARVPSFYQQPAQVYSAKGGQHSYQQDQRLVTLQSEFVPLKGAPVQYTKGQMAVPAHQEVVVQQPLPLVSAPVKTQAFAFNYQPAPAKGYYYQQRQPLRASFKGFQPLQQRYVPEPVLAQGPAKV